MRTQDKLHQSTRQINERSKEVLHGREHGLDAVEEGLDDGAEDVEDGLEEGGDGVCDGGHGCGSVFGCSFARGVVRLVDGWKEYLVFIWDFLELLWVRGGDKSDVSCLTKLSVY